MGLGERLADSREQKPPEHTGVWGQRSVPFSALLVAWALLEGPTLQLRRQNLLQRRPCFCTHPQSQQAPTGLGSRQPLVLGFLLLTVTSSGGKGHHLAPLWHIVGA